MKPIVKTPNIVLTSQTKKVGKIDKKIKFLITQMKDTLKGATNPKGVGLAAPQIGSLYRMFITKPSENSPIRVFINPCFVTLSKEKLKGIPHDTFKLEGCLSIPNVWGLVNRHKSVSIKFTDEYGKAHEESFSDFESIIIQHEMDHLEGILFPRRVLEQKEKLYKISYNEKGEEVLDLLEI